MRWSRDSRVANLCGRLTSGSATGKKPRSVVGVNWGVSREACLTLMNGAEPENPRTRTLASISERLWRSSVFFLFFPLMKDLDFLLSSQSLCDDTLKQTCRLYSTAYSASSTSLSALSHLQTGKDWDKEQVWQQIMLFNSPTISILRKNVDSFLLDLNSSNLHDNLSSGDDIKHDSMDENDSNTYKEHISDHNQEHDSMDENYSNNYQEHDSIDNHDSTQHSDTDDDIKGMMSDTEENQESTSRSHTKRSVKSVIDDDFFSLHDMQKFSEKAEAWDEIQQSRDHHDNEDDDDDSKTNDFDLGLGISTFINRPDFLSKDPDFSRNEGSDNESSGNSDNANGAFFLV